MPHPNPKIFNFTKENHLPRYIPLCFCLLIRRIASDRKERKGIRQQRKRIEREGEKETAGEKERRIEYSRMDTERCVYDPAETGVTAC